MSVTVNLELRRKSLPRVKIIYTGDVCLYKGPFMSPALSEFFYPVSAADQGYKELACM